MSITTTITYTQGNPITATVMGSPVPLLQGSTGQILHGGREVEKLDCKINSPDSRLIVRVASNGTHNVFVEKLTTVASPDPTQPDEGGATWVAAGSGQDITLTAPTVLNSKRIYAFDSPPQPGLKLTITVERT